MGARTGGTSRRLPASPRWLLPFPFAALALVLGIIVFFTARALRRRLAALRHTLRASARRSQLVRGTRAAAAQRVLRRTIDAFSPETVGDAVPKAAADSACAVCLEPIGADQSARTLRCKHALHSRCLERLWASAARRACPLCRRPMLA